MDPKLITRILSQTDLKTKFRLAKVIPKIGKADDLTKCMLCPNMCLYSCPVFNAERRLTVSPSVKSRLAYLSEEYEYEAIYRCLPCDACKQLCPMDISVNEALAKVRRSEHETAKKAIEKFEKKIVKLKVEYERDGKILYFPGCSSIGSGLAKLTIDLLEKMNIDFSVRSDIVCCGMPYYELGFTGKFLEKINQIKEIAKMYEGIISNCPHCVYILKENNIKATHIVTLLKPVGKIGGEISYHDPWILARRLGIIEEPRRLLNEMGFQIHEPVFNRENTYCCGFGGVYKFIDEEMAQKVAKTRVSHFKYEIVTACPSCKDALGGKDLVELCLEVL